MDLTLFPKVNASLNALAGIFLFLGWLAIKAKNQERHRMFMLSALASSALFLCSYLTYHYLKPGVTRYEGEGILRAIYYTILLTHTPLAAIIVPASLVALRFALQKRFDRHVRVTRWLYPVWVYVSVTGVVIYLMLYVF